jgi:iron-sulfur cluster repair protein YtfE (RIC family)
MAQHPVAMVERHILDRAHRTLERVLARLESTAEVAGTLGAPELAGMVRTLLDDVDATLRDHMAWEEQVCYPETDRLAATSWATQLLRLQHDQIRRLLDGLRAVDLGRNEPRQRAVSDLRAQLYALHAVLGSHLEQEERALLGLLTSEPAGPRAEGLGEVEPRR